MEPATDYSIIKLDIIKNENDRLNAFELIVNNLEQTIEYCVSEEKYLFIEDLLHRAKEYILRKRQ
jgi:hypothetical protein